MLGFRYQVKEFIRILENKYGTGDYSSSPFEVLIATVLSQRTKDENTHAAFRNLFSKYRTPHEILNAEDLEELIKPSGFYRVKAERIRRICSILIEKYGGKVPSKLEELLELPGVGRKTANCVLAYGFGIPAIPVDTHVHRISNRLGWVKTKTPEQTEEELRKIIPRDLWIKVNELMVKFGKDMCRPTNPRCNECNVTRCEWRDGKS